MGKSGGKYYSRGRESGRRSSSKVRKAPISSVEINSQASRRGQTPETAYRTGSAWPELILEGRVLLIEGTIRVRNQETGGI